MHRTLSVSWTFRLGLLHACVLGTTARALLPSGSGAWFGSVHQEENESVNSYVDRLGFTPAILSIFVKLPLGASDRSYLQSVIPQITAKKAILMITAEPSSGLAAVTSDAVDELSACVREAEKAGSHVMVRYAHEMNGAWYPWGQQAADYVVSFRKVATQLRNQTCDVSMVWAPNAALGYPFRGSSEEQPDKAPPGSANLIAMDSNKNGKLDSDDDPFASYYPDILHDAAAGNEYVDWVGTSIYHFGGSAEPFINNEVPYPYAFNDQLSGATGSATGGDGLGNLYARFSGDESKSKPMVIAETASEYLPDVKDGASELDIKTAWWKQVMNVHGDSSTAFDIAQHYPMIRAICWFDNKKAEESSNGMTADWRFSSAAVLSNFKQWLFSPAGTGPAEGQQYFKLQEDVAALGKDAVCS